MTAPSTDELAALLEKATDGPWRIFMSTNGQHLLGVGDSEGGGITDAGGFWRGGKERDANAQMTALAPTIAADLIACRAERDALRKAAEGMAEALRKALNYIENTEGELGITLSSGDATRAALAAYEATK